MTLLLVELPLQPPGAGTEYAYALSPDGQALASHGAAPAALLPPLRKAGDTVMAVVPAEALSWHRVELPKGGTSSSARLRAVLESLLEDSLLDDPDKLHFAVPPNAKPGAPLWVAVCDLGWLRAALQALEAAQCAVSRVIPEFPPEAGPALHVIGEPEEARMVVVADTGVAVLPLTAGAAALAAWPEEAPVTAVPATVALAEQQLHRQVTVRQRAEHWLAASQFHWDLAQFEFASAGRSRALKQLDEAWRSLLRAPQWRAARWGVLALLLAQLAGLNAWAWREQSTLDGKRTQLRQLLTQAFPGIKVVVDPQVQMERELALLQQASGAPSSRDLETILGALALALPASHTANGIEFETGGARISGLNLGPSELAEARNRLQAQGYAASVLGDRLAIKREAGP